MSRKYNIALMIETSGPGGAETVVRDIAENLDKDRFNSYVVLFKAGWFEDHLKERGINVRVIESRRSWDIGFMKRLAQFCREEKIDLIHAHLPGASVYGAMVGSFLKIPVVPTFHNEMFMPGSADRFVGLKFWIVRRLATRIVMVADFMKQNYIDKGRLRPDKMVTIYNGIKLDTGADDFDHDILKREVGLKPDDLVIGHVANLRVPKGHKYLVASAAKVCKEIPRTKFLMMGEEGDGKLKEELEKQIADKNLRDKIIFLGFRKDVHRLLHLFDIFVLSSISEGLPLSVVEAMAAGKPVVATRVGGLPEIVEDGKTGFLVPPADSEALSGKLIELLKDEQLRKNLGQTGRQLAEEKFSLATMINNYQNLYRELIG